MKLNISLDSMFTMFNSIQEYIPESNLIEISVKQHQITLCLENKHILYFSDVLSLCHDVMVNPQDTYVTHHDKNFYIIIPNIDDNMKNSSKFDDFMKVIEYMAEHICQCPALEYVIYSNYIKCFLDKPGIKVADIVKLEELFNSECTLELGANRPYALFVNTTID